MQFTKNYNYCSSIFTELLIIHNFEAIRIQQGRTSQCLIPWVSCAASCLPAPVSSDPSWNCILNRQSPEQFKRSMNIKLIRLQNYFPWFRIQKPQSNEFSWSTGFAYQIFPFPFTASWNRNNMVNSQVFPRRAISAAIVLHQYLTIRRRKNRGLSLRNAT